MPCWIPIVFCTLTLLLPTACSSVPTLTQPIHQSKQGPIHNLHQLAPGLYSGNEPATSAHYDQLSDIGIKTVISVDAIAPDPDLAAQYNIRIVHLPIGYDGIEESRAIELASAITQLDHPIYLHCHHGKHRGPAALCVGAIGAGIITNDQAIEFMTTAGTSQSYPGLWDAARSTRALDHTNLGSVQAFPTHAPVSGFIESMGQLDRLHDRLWDLAEDDWQTPEDHPDLSPSAVSGQLYDHMRSMLQLDFFSKRGSMMRSRFEAAIDTAGNVEAKINSNDLPEALNLLSSLSNSCIDCHERFRN